MFTDQLIQLLETLKADLVNSMQSKGIDATGNTAKQLTVTANGDVAELQIPGYMLLLETGRGPTAPNAIKADPPMIARIKAWCQAKGIPEEAAWAIKKSIDKKGFKGKPGLLSDAIGDENIDFRLNSILESIANDLLQIVGQLIA